MIPSCVYASLATAILTGLAFASADVVWFSSVVPPRGVNNDSATGEDDQMKGEDDQKPHNGSVEINFGFNVTANPQTAGHGVVQVGGPTIVVQNIYVNCCPPLPAGAPVTTSQKNSSNNTRERAKNMTQPLCSANSSYLCLIEPVGCFRDSYVDPRPLPKLIADFRRDVDRNNLNKTIEACAREAKKRGFGFFGIQSYGDCWSGNGAEKSYNRDGPSRNCIRGVGQSGANFVYRFQDAIPQPCENCGKPRHLCFPGKSEVELSNGKVVTMSDLRLGDKVKTPDSDGKPVYSEVIIFLHKNKKATEEFLNIVVDDGNQITLSSKHLIFVKKSISQALPSAIFASQVETGHYVYVNGKLNGFNYRPVAYITKVTEKGLYAPLTSQGTLIVDNVLVSCFAHWWSHDLANLAMAPMRLYLAFMRALSSFGGWAQLTVNHLDLRENNGVEIHWYPGLLLKVTSSLSLL